MHITEGGSWKMVYDSEKLVLENTFKEKRVVPKKYEKEVLDMVLEKCNACIDKLLQVL